LAPSALVVAATFAKRKESAMRLARFEMLLEREPDNKFIGGETVSAA